MLCRAVLFLLIVSCSLKGCVSVMCYWCSGVGDDRDCETRPYAVRTGPVYLNCRANFCLSAKVIDAETGQVQSFARLCDNVPRGNLCIRDSKLLTCYESCTTDLCNSGNPSPLQLPTVSYAGDAQKQQQGAYQDGFSPIQTREVLGRPYRTNSLKSARNIRYGPKRDMWLATPQRDFHSTRRFPEIVTNTPRSAQFALRSKPASSDFLKAGMGRNGDADIELIGDKEFFGKGFKTTASESNRNQNLNKIVTSSEKGLVYPKEDDDIPVVDRPKKTTAANKPESLVPRKEENANDDHARANEDGDYMATMDIGYGERRQEVNDVQFIDEETAESEGVEEVYVGELDLDQIGRGGDGLVAWSGRIVERQELRREDEVPVSNLVIEEDRERGLIQTFRANTTKTTKDADKPEKSEVSMASKVVKKVKKSEKPTKVSTKSSLSTTTKPRNMKASTTVRGSNVLRKVTSTKTLTTVTERPATSKASTSVQSTTTPTKKTDSKITTIRNTIVPTKKTLKGKKSQKSKTNSTTKATTTTTSTTTTTTTTAAPTFKKASTILSKTKAAIKLIKTKQTTLPYIWKETSAWNEDGTVADRTHQATWTSSKNTDDVTINITKVTKHKEVHLTDFLELQSTTEPLVVNATSISEPQEKVNKTSLPQKAPGKRNGGEIYLDESLTENLLGLRKDFPEETKAELTGSDSSAPSGSLLLLSVSMLFGRMYL